MKCEGCGNPAASVTRTTFVKDEKIEMCDGCGNVRPPRIVDAYFQKPYFDPSLGTFIESKAHKKMVMDQQGVHEDGDRAHGSLDKGVRKEKRPRLTKEFRQKIARVSREAVKKAIGGRP